MIVIAAAYTTCGAAALTHSAGSTAAIVVSITITITIVVAALSHSAGSTSAAGTVIGST